MAPLSHRHAQELHKLRADEGEARRERELLEWTAQISTRAEETLCAIRQAEARERGAWRAAEQFADSLLTEWNEADHPRAPKGTPIGGQWVSKDGGSIAAVPQDEEESDQERLPDELIVTAEMLRARHKREAFSDLLQAAREMGAAIIAGLGKGAKAVVNGLATAVRSVATLGLNTDQLELLGVSDEDRARGYDTAATIATGSGQVLIAVGTGGMTSALAKGGAVARTASGALVVYDAAGNAVGVVQGVYDASQNGVTLSNGVQIATGALGLGANAKAVKGLLIPPIVVKPPPKLPAYSPGEKTRGVFRAKGEDVPLLSGRAGPAASLAKATPGFNAITKTHVEGHAAAIMRQQGIKEATIYINNPKVCRPCQQNLANMLPSGAKLTVVLPSGVAKTFIGNAR